MGKAYSDEVSYIPQTLQWAIGQDIDRLRKCVRSCANRSVIAVGSGGSFTAAAYVAGLHERQYGKLSRAATPLEVVTGFEAGDVASIYLSAEGRNNDILAAAKAHCGADRGSIALTLTPANPLLAFCESSGVATPVKFDIPWQKDGYLATNSLVAMMALFAQAYLDEPFATAIPDAGWVQQRREELATSEALSCLAAGADLIVLYGGAGKIAAVDLESKFAEGALGACQPVDYRQFAHGRHLQLAQQKPPVVIALGNEHDRLLMDASLAHFPSGVQVLRVELPTGYAVGELFGVIHAMLIVEVVSQRRQMDVGQPHVPSFGRALYSTDVWETVSRFSDQVPSVLRHKVPRLPAGQIHSWVEAAQLFVSRVEKARFAGIVCDFDGTCCYTPRRWDGLATELIDDFARLLEGGVGIAFATGRGGSIQTDLQRKLSHEHWPKVLVGYFSGSTIVRLNEKFCDPMPDARLTDLRSWLTEHGLIPESPSDTRACGGQMSIRFSGAFPKDAVTSAIAHWLTVNGYSDWRVFCSGHSVDVLTEAAGKRNVICQFAQALQADPNEEILRVGDSGHFSGNDYELLCDGLGLSVATVSPLKTSCWNLLPEGVHGAAGMHHYLSALEVEDSKARFSERFIDSVHNMLRNVKVRQ